MPPRLPVRHPVELVHLGVLLPWAARTSSTATAAASALAHASPAGPSGIDANDVVEPIAGPSTPLPPPPRPRLPPTSPIQHLLTLPSPPPPRIILQHLIDNPNDLTRPAGELLASYARRVHDIKAERGVWELMVRRKVVPVGMARKARFSHEWQAGEGFRIRPWQWSDVSMALGKGKTSANAKLKTKPTLPPEPATKTNHWASRIWPPLESLPSDRQYTVAQLMGHLHFLLLMGKPPEFEDAWKLLPQAVDHQATLDACGRRKRKGKRRDDEWGKSEKDDAGAPGLNLFNLYLAYPPCPVAELTTAYLTRSAVPPNRQSIHLTILALLSTPLPPNFPDPPPTPPSRSRKPTPTSSPAPDPAPPLSPVEIASKVISTLDFYLSQRATPHLDTWRHIAQFAVFHELKALGRLAFEAWFAALEGVEREVARAWAEEDKAGVKEEAALKGGAGGAGEPSTSSTPTPTPTTTSEPPRFVFTGFGTKKRRWTKIVHAMVEKGWVEELEEKKDTKGRWGYAWKTGVGEDDLAEAGAMVPKSEEGPEVEQWSDGAKKKEKAKLGEGKDRKLEGRGVQWEGRVWRSDFPIYRPATTLPASLPPKGRSATPTPGSLGHLLPRQPPTSSTHAPSSPSSPSLSPSPSHAHRPPRPGAQRMSDLSRTSHDASHTTTHISNLGS
ncbi:hypothetical protein IAT38_004070 [Cryptococcus sp. DSM 104549]